MLPEFKELKFKNERWKVYIHNTNYWISNKGRVYSVKRSGAKGGMLDPYKRKGGYVSVYIRKQNDLGRYLTKQVMVHRMVIETFKRLPEPWEFCNHKDGNKHNNELSNLEWTTRLGNARHAAKVIKTYKIGEEHGISKFTDREALFICWLKGTYGDVIQPKQIADFFGVSSACIQEMWIGKKSWSFINEIKR